MHCEYNDFLHSDYKLLIIGDSGGEWSSHIIFSLYNYRITPTLVLEDSYGNLQNYFLKHFCNPRSESLGAVKMAPDITCGWEMDHSKYCHVYILLTYTH